MDTTSRVEYCEFWIDHGFSDSRQPAEHIGVFDGDQIYPKSTQTRERLSSDHLKFAPNDTPPLNTLFLSQMPRCRG